MRAAICLSPPNLTQCCPASIHSGAVQSAGLQKAEGTAENRRARPSGTTGQGVTAKLKEFGPCFQLNRVLESGGKDVEIQATPASLQVRRTATAPGGSEDQTSLATTAVGKEDARLQSR